MVWNLARPPFAWGGSAGGAFAAVAFKSAVVAFSGAGWGLGIAAPLISAWRADTSSRAPFVACQRAKLCSTSTWPSAFRTRRPASAARVTVLRCKPRRRAKAALVSSMAVFRVYGLFRVCSDYPEQRAALVRQGCSDVPGVSPMGARKKSVNAGARAKFVHVREWPVDPEHRNKPVAVRVSAVPGSRNRGRNTRNI